MKIYVDYDDCICETARAFTEIADKLFGKKVPYEMVKHFNLQESFELTDEEYEKLILEFGKASVDNQLRRISNNNYKGCCNYETIRTWCKERLERQNTASIVTQKKNSFFNFQQRTYDMKALERELVGY